MACGRSHRQDHPQILLMNTFSILSRLIRVVGLTRIVGFDDDKSLSCSHLVR